MLDATNPKVLSLISQGVGGRIECPESRIGRVGGYGFFNQEYPYDTPIEAKSPPILVMAPLLAATRRD